MAVKRKAADTPAKNSPSKRHDAGETKAAFRSDLFEPAIVKQSHGDYAASGPYPHAVVSNLIKEELLRDVRSEITENIHFTLKETDIYRIHQSGDLANLSNLDQESLKRLPSLVKLRDALYSPEFRRWVSKVTGAGKLSGLKTDMAVNVYTPGSYLLCHDDVIGSRRVSYILYLTDPDKPWQPDWGGGLRLYPTEPKQNKAGEEIKVPLAEWSLNIPPSFSQLSFFAVRPGESYHDVEEVYHGANAEEDKNRIRMAVSGWFHIPQEGEDGFEKGVEEAQAQKSSLAQLQGAADEFDEPRVFFRHFDEPRRVANAQGNGTEVDPGDSEDQDETILTEQDLTFLIQYIAPGFLVPDKLEELSQAFEETSILQLDTFLAKKFATPLKAYIKRAEYSEPAISSKANISPPTWPLARPPHKHRFAYLVENTQTATETDSPLSKLLQDLLHSHSFKKWLALATGLRPHSLIKQHALARRFRAGHDYALASTYMGDLPRLEFTINLTPSTGWERNQTERFSTKGKTKSNGAGSIDDTSLVDVEPVEYGGEEVYMATDDEAAFADSKSLPSVGKKAVHDPAVYHSGDGEDEDGILFSSAPAWNTFNVVLRDKGTMRFVKYVSQAAKGDRWDIKGEIDLADDAFGSEDEDEDGMGDIGNEDIEEDVEYELNTEDPEHDEDGG